MQALLESHLLDGALGRASAYFAIALLLGILIWERILNCRLSGHSRYIKVACLIGLFGALIAINSTALEAGNPFDAQAMMLPDAANLFNFLFQTHVGKSWLAFIVFLMLAMSNRTAIRFISFSGMLGSLVLSSHAGEKGVLQPGYWLDFLHLSMALSWLGGISIMILMRLGHKNPIEVKSLQLFSRYALPFFLLIVATGILQAVVRYMEEHRLNTSYIVMLAIKMAVVIAIMLSAWRLRRSLKNSSEPIAGFDQKFDNGLTVEYFFAILLLLITGLLTQLPAS